MPKSDWCRKNMDKVNRECYGGELKEDTLRNTQKAIEFTRRAPFMEMQSTMSVNRVRTIKDPIVQGKVLEMIKAALSSGKDPRTNEPFGRKDGIQCITTPLIKWMIEYAETGQRPPYVRRGSHPKQVDVTGLMHILDEFTKIKIDHRVGGYIIPHSIME